MPEQSGRPLPEPGFKPSRDRILVQVGAFVQQGETVYRIEQVLDFETLIGKNVETGRSVPLRIGDLRPFDPDRTLPPTVRTELSEIADEDWQIAEKRYAAIKPLVDRYTVGRADAERHAAAAGVDVATLYRWLKLYRDAGVVTALIPQKRGWKSGRHRLPPHAEEVIAEVIKDFYLKLQRPTAQAGVMEVLRRCEVKGLEPPSPSTIRARLAEIPERDSLRGRGFNNLARSKFTPAPSTFPNAEYPLAVVQIDHTLLDIILVDDVHRKPIGRPYLTTAIDACSRMFFGYHLSFDAPSVTSVALCVVQGILPKEEWLTLHGVEAEWPVWGFPRTLHMDNASEFRSEDLRQACSTYGIHVEYRALGRPEDGGRVERVQGTFLRDVHGLPGTTFSSVKERQGYDSEKHATMTKDEFEVWLVTWITKVYHRRKHSKLGMTPLRAWEIGVFGNAEVQGIGVPRLPADRLTVLLDFLPSKRRTIQPDGVTIDHWSYYGEALRRWIGAVDPETGESRKFIFRRDPRNIDHIWFFDPQLKEYFRLPFANPDAPSLSLWEDRQIKAKLKQEGKHDYNERDLLRALTELRALVDAAQEKTKKVRRQAQRQRDHAKQVSPVDPLKASSGPAEPTPAPPAGLLSGKVKPFGEIA